MTENEKVNQNYVVLGQKYAYATISLILGISCFINLVGMEKAILAVIFGAMALRASPAPKLRERRAWAKTGLALGTVIVLVVPTIILLNLDRLRSMVEALTKLINGK
jgi:hypothetical protein